jgi:ribonuclease-3 family protein
MSDSVNQASLPSVMALAYLGDAYYSLSVREMLIKHKISKSKDLNLASLKYVTAEKQAEMFEKIKTALTEDEALCARRAYNSTHLNPPKRAKIKDYRAATALEALIGMLYYTKNTERLEKIMTVLLGGCENDTEN